MCWGNKRKYWENVLPWRHFYQTYQGHIDGSTEGDSRHGVQHVDVQLGQRVRAGEHQADCGDGGAAVHGYIGHDVPEMKGPSIHDGNMFSKHLLQN